MGLRIYDGDVSAVRDDLRENATFREWDGVKPHIYLFPELCSDEDRCPAGWFSIYYNSKCALAKYLTKGFNLTFDETMNHYTLSNHCKTNFKFLYKNGYFYEYNGIGYKKVVNLGDKVKSCQIKSLIELFETYYK